MKWKQFLPLLLSSAYFAGNSQDINLTNRGTTFTNLQGQLFSPVDLVRGDLDGVIWRKESGGGRICYTNLNPMLLEAWGIPTNRIEIARARVQQRASNAAQEKAWALKQAQLETAARAKADAQEAATAPGKAKAEQMAADAQAIANLEQQIRDAKARVRRAKALAHDYNKANLHNEYAPTLYVRESEKVKIQEAEDQLKKMKADFALKYKDR
jgi:regulator of protease activity HflC (stomatin/prohibitin superfamily)